MLYYVSQYNDLIESFTLSQGERMYKKSEDVTPKHNCTIKQNFL